VDLLQSILPITGTISLKDIVYPVHSARSGIAVLSGATDKVSSYTEMHSLHSAKPME